MLELDLSARRRFERGHDGSIDSHLALGDLDQYVAEAAVPDVTDHAIGGERKLGLERGGGAHVVFDFGMHAWLTGS